MSLTAAAVPLADTVLSLRLPEESIHHRVRQIHQDVLAHSQYMRAADFKAIHPRDLEFLFDAYDNGFLGGLCRRALNGQKIRFRLSPRMTRAGGKTTRFVKRSGEVGYEIAIAISILFDGFGEEGRRASACGLECGNRLEALQRIFEHELVHVIEGLCWQSSNCSAARFQDIAARLFLHRIPHSQPHHKAGASRGIGHPARFARDLLIRRPAADRPRESHHKARDRPRGGRRGPRVLEWLAV